MSLPRKEGDLTQKITVRSSDEVGNIAGSLNVFLENLREIIKKISECEYKLAGNSEHVNNIVTASTDAVSKVNATMSVMEDNVLEMSEMVHKIAEDAKNNDERMTSVIGGDKSPGRIYWRDWCKGEKSGERRNTGEGTYAGDNRAYWQDAGR